jgi:cupin fold WbuC family metalloprotein
MDRVAEQASQSQRLRKNYNFHDPAELVQRFLNVLQPGTYVRPHRHCAVPGMNRFELFLVLQGSLGILLLNPQGEIIQQEYLSADGELRGVELPAGTYHTLIALAPNTVTFEVKEGPYLAATDKEFLELFPEENTPEAETLTKKWQQCFALNH